MCCRHKKQDNVGATLHGIINYLSGENALLKNIISGKERVALDMKTLSHFHPLKMKAFVSPAWRLVFNSPSYAELPLQNSNAIFFPHICLSKWG